MRNRPLFKVKQLLGIGNFVLLAVLALGVGAAVRAENPNGLATAAVPNSCQDWYDAPADQVRSVCGTSWPAGGQTVLLSATDPFIKDGCSCEASCGYHGSCCFDAKDWCQGLEVFGDNPPLPTSGGFDVATMDGEQWVQVTEEQSVSSINWVSTEIGKGYRAMAIVPSDGSGANSAGDPGIPSSISFAAINSTDLREIAKRYAGGECGIGHYLGDSSQQFYTVYARTGGSGVTGAFDADAICSGIGMRYPPGTFSLDPPRKFWRDDQYVPAIDLGPVTDAEGRPTLPVLRRISIANGSHKFDNRRVDFNCSLIRNADGSRWLLSGNAAQTWGSIACEARLVRGRPGTTLLDTVCPTETIEYGALGSGSAMCTDTGINPGVYDARAISSGSDDDVFTRIAMQPELGHVCFLQTYNVIDELKVGSGRRGVCRVEREANRWWLRAEAAHGIETFCQARCASIPATASATGPADPAIWPPTPTAVLNSDQTDIGPNQVRGPHMALFQAGDYDRPLLIFDGFDASNERGVAALAGSLAPLLRTALDDGFDVWLVDNSDGGQPVLESAMENARAIDIAWRHDGWNLQNPGREVVAAGLSMGGLATRIALASWEDGVYAQDTLPNGSANPEFLSTEFAGDPPVALFASIGGPQEGANVPAALQTLVQDVGSHWDLGSAHAAVNVPAAREMLETWMEAGPLCDDVVTQDCPTWIGSRRVFIGRDNATSHQTVYLHCDEFGCRVANYSSDTCPRNVTASRTALLDAIATRGRRGNGYPGSVLSAGVSNGSWLVQACENLAPEEREDCRSRIGHSGPLTAQDSLGQIDFRVDAGSDFAHGCDRNITIRGELTDADLRPGDLSGNTIANLLLTDLPNQVRSLKVSQFLPFMFVPTESALACPGATGDPGCRSQNRLGERFDFVRSNPEYNGRHDDLHWRRAIELLAYFADYFDGDGDGYCNHADNPVLRSHNEKFGLTVFDAMNDPRGITTCLDDRYDCGSQSAASHPGATEICDYEDNDCDGAIDEEFHVGQACDGPDGDRCREGVFVCDGDGGRTCTDHTGNSGEICCDNLDNDCDGEIDEGCRCLHQREIGAG